MVLIYSAIVALYNDERDSEIDWRQIRAEPLGPIVHCLVYCNKYEKWTI